MALAHLDRLRDFLKDFENFPEKLADLEAATKRLDEEHKKMQQDFVPIAKFHALERKLDETQRILAKTIDQQQLNDTTNEIETKFNEDEMDECLSDAELVAEDKEMGDVEGCAIWLDNNGDLQIDPLILDDTFDKLEETWAVQKAKLEERWNKNNGTELEWVPNDTDTSDAKCLWSMVFGRTHFWTTAESGNFACRACAYNQAICFGNTQGRWEALPLPNELTGEASGITTMFVSPKARVTKSRQARGLWPAG
ncbi:hypothetical protein M436DRAFT_82948 [Aureobasidium namibiae CBS 147.97]|uniref:Uncharacterized protein n=1 Tax=Aureobasidium namibiae CBS 147.97 TaxID=1043004 RepID=A0A074WKA3_9PEZI